MSAIVMSGDAQPKILCEVRKNRNVLCIKCAHSFNESCFKEHAQNCHDVEDERIFYTPPNKDYEAIPSSDIDRFDLPISEPSVQLKSLGYQSDQEIQLPVHTKRDDRHQESCSFCEGKIKVEEKFGVLPCEHSIHFNCVKKWLVIVKPCKICKSDETSDTSWSDYTSSTLKGSV